MSTQKMNRIDVNFTLLCVWKKNVKRESIFYMLLELTWV
uniref:Uncharacterized protein n=1 Tax=Nelumbo nucifera TaxID=4432 RepID=A0A822XSJ8_NELNU|nr:TPA_asm: hypothetical protein HUJ06_024136 [Nelumbo nucifera]